MAPGEKTRKAIAARPKWPAAVPTGRRLPRRRSLFAGCGISLQAAQTDGHMAEARGIDPDPTRRDDPRRTRAREASP